MTAATMAVSVLPLATAGASPLADARAAETGGSPSAAAALARIQFDPAAELLHEQVPTAAAQRRPSAATTTTTGDAGAIRRSGIGLDYVDVCGDSSGTNDVRRLFVGEDSSYGAMYFGASMCAPVSLSELVVGAVEFHLWTGATDHPDYGVMLDADPSANPRITVIHMPSQDPATWQITYQDSGIVLDDGYEIGGVLPFSALHDHDQFAFGVLTWGSGDTPTDHVPERDAPVLIYPYSCNIEVWHSAAVTPQPGRALEVRTALVAAGYPLVGSGETFDVRGVDDLDALAAIPGIAEVSRPAAAVRHATPTDPDWTRQWQLSAVGAPTAWETTARSSVTIAVVDDGVDARRSDLAGRVVDGWDSSLGKPIAAGRNSDMGGHGTAVAGFAAASGDNGRELTGIDWGARIAPFRVFDASGCGTSTTVADGVRRAADAGARIINLSVGFTTNHPAFADAVAYAVSRGVLVVGAVGNDAQSGGASYPASYPGVLGVGASTRDNGIAFYSNRGAYVDLVAPGGDLSGTTTGDLIGLSDRGAEPMAGTSFAAPIVAGAAALYLGLNPGLSAGELTSALASTARDLGPAGRDDASGHGLLDLAALVAASPPGAPTYPTPNARDVTDTCDEHQQRRFDDTAGTAHEYMINCVAGYEVTTGKTATTYAPNALLTRGQTATFLARTLGAAGVELPAEGSDTCAETDVHATNVERLIAKNIIQAPPDRRCLTSQPISRELMAHWTRQALAVGGVRTDESANWYSDDDNSPYQRHINEITTLGIVTGKGDATFGPTETLARGQMATFLARTLDALRNARGI